MTSQVLDDYEQLKEKQLNLETEIQAIVEELTSGENPGGINTPLVDKDGYPRADIDVYRVRHQRHQLICLQNDHKEIMKQIETILPAVFTVKMQRTNMNPSSSSHVTSQKYPVPNHSNPPIKDQLSDKLEPFAVIENVTNGSPSFIAGLQSGDQLLQFGTVNATNHRELQAIKDVVRYNIDNEIQIKIQRQRSNEYEIMELVLTPQHWAGQGVLGCGILPLS